MSMSILMVGEDKVLSEEGKTDIIGDETSITIIVSYFYLHNKYNLMYHL